MITARDILLGLAVPVLLTALAAIVAGRFRQGWLTAIFLAAAFAVSFVGIELRVPQFPPHNVEGWLFYLVLPAAALGVLDDRLRPPNWVRAILGGLLFLMAMCLTLWPLKHAMSVPQIAVWVAVLGLAQTVWWLLVDGLPDATSKVLVPALLGMTASAAALDLLNTGQIEFGKLAGMLALVLWALAGIDAWTKRSSLAYSASIVVTVILWGLLTLGHFYGDVTWRDFILLTVAPLAIWIGALPPLRGKRPWMKLTAAAVVVVVLLAIPAVPAAIELRQTMLQETRGGPSEM